MVCEKVCSKKSVCCKSWCGVICVCVCVCVCVFVCVIQYNVVWCV